MLTSNLLSHGSRQLHSPVHSCKRAIKDQYGHAFINSLWDCMPWTLSSGILSPKTATIKKTRAMLLCTQTWRPSPGNGTGWEHGWEGKKWERLFSHFPLPFVTKAHLLFSRKSLPLFLKTVLLSTDLKAT